LLTLAFAPDKPEGLPEPNWSLTPQDGKFNLSFRMYGPDPIQPANRPRSRGSSRLLAGGSKQEMLSFNSWPLRLHNALITNVFLLPAIFYA
jgi:hypothetical protein